MEKWRVSLSPEAERELARAYITHPHLRLDILARLRALEDFPPQKWFFVYRHHGHHLFRADTGQFIRLSGEAHLETKTVQITHVIVLRER